MRWWRPMRWGGTGRWRQGYCECDTDFVATDLHGFALFCYTGRMPVLRVCGGLFWRFWPC